MKMFFEEQTLGATSVRLLYFLAATISLAVVFFSLKDKVDNQEIILTMYFVVGITVTTYFLVFVSSSLKRITQRGTEVKYRPFIWNWKVFVWHGIKSVTEENVEPIGDFGGWGYRFALKGKQGIIKGNGPAVKIEMKSGKIYVISTNRRTEFLKSTAQYLNEEGLNG